MNAEPAKELNGRRGSSVVYLLPNWEIYESTQKLHLRDSKATHMLSFAIMAREAVSSMQ